MSVQLLRRHFTVDEYYRMAETGILSEDDRVELIEGEIIQMTPIGSRHASHVKRLNQFFSCNLGARVIVSVQDPIRVDQHSEPQPDIVLLRPRSDFYAEAHPKPEDVFLVVEVADTSIDFDRQVKTPLYAKADILEVWLVDISGGSIEVYREPSLRGYEQVERFQRGQDLSPQAFPDIKLPAAEMTNYE
ncbi:MAG: Uma2 family endonuclease [bacterium]